MAKITSIGIMILILLSFGISAYLYPYLPDRLASHWNIYGQVDGYMPKWLALFLMPVISVAFLLLFVALYKVPSFRKNLGGLQKHYERFVFIFVAFLFYLYLLTVAWHLEYRFNIIQLLAPAFAILFYYAGILIENAKRNIFIGVRFPWTLRSDAVWNKTNRLGGKLFRYCGVLALIGALFPLYAFLFVLLPVIAITIYLALYSYNEDKKRVRKRR